MKSRIMEIDSYIKAIFDNEVLGISVSLKDQQKHFSKIMWFSITEVETLIQPYNTVGMKSSFPQSISLKTCFLQLVNKYGYNLSPGALGGIYRCVNILLTSVSF